MYFHYKPATATEPGSIMLGMEGFPPTDPRHSKVGASDPASMTGGPKWQKMEHTHDEKYPVPATYNGQRIGSLTASEIADLVKVKTANIESGIIEAKPANHLEGTTFVQVPKPVPQPVIHPSEQRAEHQVKKVGAGTTLPSK